MFVIISDMWLDNVEVLEKLQTMFSGLMHFPVVSVWTKPIIKNLLNILVLFNIHLKDLLCLLKAIQQCLPPALSFVGTSPLLHMAKVRSSHLKVRTFEAWELYFLAPFIRLLLDSLAFFGFRVFESSSWFNLWASQHPQQVRSSLVSVTPLLVSVIYSTFICLLLLFVLFYVYILWGYCMYSFKEWKWLRVGKCCWLILSLCVSSVW